MCGCASQQVCQNPQKKGRRARRVKAADAVGLFLAVVAFLSLLSAIIVASLTLDQKLACIALLCGVSSVISVIIIEEGEGV